MGELYARLRGPTKIGKCHRSSARKCRRREAALPAAGVWEGLVEGKAPAVRTLLNELCSGVRASLLDTVQPTGLTALSLTVLNDRKEALAVLLEKGASVTSVGRDGLGPLHHAAFLGSVPLVTRLVSAGASWTDGFQRGVLTPLECALFSRSREMVAMAVGQVQLLKQVMSPHLLQQLHIRVLFAAVKSDITSCKDSGSMTFKCVKCLPMTKCYKAQKSLYSLQKHIASIRAKAPRSESDHDSDIEDDADDAVIEDDADDTVIEDDADDTVIENDADDTVIEDDVDDTVIEDDVDDTVIEDEADDTVIEDDADDTELLKMMLTIQCLKISQQFLIMVESDY
ncbi:Serralysin-like metalloprotease C-terminal [Trinorchestia longiramus]|nr:Serralysin-like metalloprotease C-terminal [Trinorchestia longiramus]